MVDDGYSRSMIRRSILMAASALLSAILRSLPRRWASFGRRVAARSIHSSAWCVNLSASSRRRSTRSRSARGFVLGDQAADDRQCLRKCLSTGELRHPKPFAGRVDKVLFVGVDAHRVTSQT